ncbi:hypothetical protein IW262DRAFT_1454678 [Armillaria fumosa]|nr:hypothetical protein IW262DRAFT_1454678 [Armillaria fumosa]
MNTNHNQLRSTNIRNFDFHITLHAERNSIRNTALNATRHYGRLKNHLDPSGRNPYYSACKRGFLNNNSLKMKLFLPDYHHYCIDCEKELQSSSALKICLPSISMMGSCELMRLNVILSNRLLTTAITEKVIVSGASKGGKTSCLTSGKERRAGRNLSHSKNSRRRFLCPGWRL